MGCATKNAKVVAISLGSLQRLIALKAVPQSAVPLIITTMADCMAQGVDIQLRILQTLLSLVTNFPAIHGELLGEALLLCFKLQESRIAVVSSTAAATLRQLVMFVVDKVVDEDRRDDVKVEELADVTLPNGQLKALGLSAQDAFAVFEDLCLLANSEKPLFLKLDSLRKTFSLELIESVLTNYHDLFRKVGQYRPRARVVLMLSSARGTSPTTSTSPMPARPESIVRQAEFPTHPPIDSRSLLAPEAVLLGIEDGSRSLPDASHQDNQRRLRGRCSHLPSHGKLPHRTRATSTMDARTGYGDHARVCAVASV